MREEVLIVAGEASADAHGSRVLAALRQSCPRVRAWGIGGRAMRKEGMHMLAAAEDISLCGLTEVVFALPRLLRILTKITRLAATRRPRVALLIDLPDFNLRLAARLKQLGIPVVYFISPQVWAWRERRVRKIAQVVDEMLVILPFEQPFYARHGVRAQFVGHPLVEQLSPMLSQAMARRALGCTSARGPIIALLPGSRAQELRRHLPAALGGLAQLLKRHPQMQVILPVASTLDRQDVVQLLAQAPDIAARTQLTDGRAREAVAAADVALVSSGTATLETALLGRSMVVMYRVSWLTYQILKRLVKVAHIGLVNLIAEERLVPELVQHALSAQTVARELGHLLDNPDRRLLLEQRLRGLRSRLGEHPTAATVALALRPYFASHTPPAGEKRAS